MQHIIKVLMINTERKDQAFESAVEDVMKIGRHCGIHRLTGEPGAAGAPSSAHV